MWRKLSHRSPARPGNIGRCCSDRAARENSGCDVRLRPRNPYFFSQTGSGLVRSPRSLHQRTSRHLPSGAVRRAVKLRRDPGHRAKPLYPFYPHSGLFRQPRAPHGQGLVQALVWGQMPLRFGLPRRHPNQPWARIPLLDCGREPFGNSLSSGTGPFKAIMSHKALGPRGVHPKAG